MVRTTQLLSTFDATPWGKRELTKEEIDAIKVPGEKLDKAHSNKISNLLQHCTVVRVEPLQGWEMDQMYAHIEPIMAAFTKSFPRKSEIRVLRVFQQGHMLEQVVHQTRRIGRASSGKLRTELLQPEVVDMAIESFGRQLRSSLASVSYELTEMQARKEKLEREIRNARRRFQGLRTDCFRLPQIQSRVRSKK